MANFKTTKFAGNSCERSLSLLMPHKAKRDPLGVHQTGTLFSCFLACTSTNKAAHKSLQTFKKPKHWRIGHLQLLKKVPRDVYSTKKA